METNYQLTYTYWLPWVYLSWNEADMAMQELQALAKAKEFSVFQGLMEREPGTGGWRVGVEVWVLQYGDKLPLSKEEIDSFKPAEKKIEDEASRSGLWKGLAIGAVTGGIIVGLGSLIVKRLRRKKS